LKEQGNGRTVLERIEEKLTLGMWASLNWLRYTCYGKLWHYHHWLFRFYYQRVSWDGDYVLYFVDQRMRSIFAHS